MDDKDLQLTLIGNIGLTLTNVLESILMLSGRLVFKHESWAGFVATAISPDADGYGGGVWLEHLVWKPSKPYFAGDAQPALPLIKRIGCPRANSQYFSNNTLLNTIQDGEGQKDKFIPMLWSEGPARPPFADTDGLGEGDSPVEYFENGNTLAVARTRPPCAPSQRP